MDNLIGQSVGRYHILEPLGRGGMAAVYKAFDTRLKREVAIKFIRLETISSQDLPQVLRALRSRRFRWPGFPIRTSLRYMTTVSTRDPLTW